MIHIKKKASRPNPSPNSMYNTYTYDNNLETLSKIIFSPFRVAHKTLSSSWPGGSVCTERPVYHSVAYAFRTTQRNNNRAVSSSSEADKRDSGIGVSLDWKSGTAVRGYEYRIDFTV